MQMKRFLLAAFVSVIVLASGLLSAGCNFTENQDIGMTPPAVPKNVQIIAGDEFVTLTWEAPDNVGGASEIWYQVFLDGISLEDNVKEEGYVSTGLENGVEYRIDVRTVNAMGHSAKVTKYATPFSDIVVGEVLVFNLLSCGMRYEVTVTEYAGNAVEIPSDYFGLPVVRIASVSTNIEYMFVPLSVIEVEQDAMAGIIIYYAGEFWEGIEIFGARIANLMADREASDFWDEINSLS